ncbi:polysaccharide biosynthesis/export family protein [Vulgatibacter sp.]|uniref:polysaccharide biosynthesis/export family protein n=1 Tax=Vulgatibacter sp. TaxID=1971226 RepID=UPI0035678E4C
MRSLRWAMWLVAVVSLAGCASGHKPLETKPETEYRLGSEDVVEVMVFQSEDLSRTVPVRPDGKISLPLLGDVEARGLTTAELARKIEGSYAEYVQAPRVTVIVREVNAPRVYVIGEVARPGAYPIRGDLDVVQALALAGGLGDFASRGSIVLIRRGAEGDVRTTLDYDELIEDDEQGHMPRLLPGDTLYVP